MRYDGAIGPSVPVSPISNIQGTNGAHGEPRLQQNAAPPQPRSVPEQPAQERAFLAPELHVELDKEANRIVNRWLDPTSKEVVDQYPSEAQLAISRAIGAYLSAKNLRG